MAKPVKPIPEGFHTLTPHLLPWRPFPPGFSH